MNDVVCFIIEGKSLYLEKVLVEFNDIPVFFICHNENEYFAVLCTDIENEEYIIVEITILDICSLLKKSLEMNTFFTKQVSYWYVKTADNFENDFVESRQFGLDDEALLPTKGAYYEITSDEIREYLEALENMLWEASKAVVPQQMLINYVDDFFPEFQNYMVDVSAFKASGTFIAARTYPLYREELKLAVGRKADSIKSLVYDNREEPLLEKISIQCDIDCSSRHIAA